MIEKFEFDGFNIENNMIVVCDWGNYIYHIDFNGKEINYWSDIDVWES